MQTPFTPEQFLDVMIRYNQAVWPMQVVLYVVAAALIWLAAQPGHPRWVGLILGVLWVWMGVAYHWIFFTAINPAAWVFGAFFVLQGLLFVHVGAVGDLALRFDPDAFGWTGAAFLLYALVVYPLLGTALGHAYPASPTFGLPCPTTIATFGLLLWAAKPVPVRVVVIPALWSLIGASAAFQFGIREDYGLLVAGVLGTILVLMKNRRLKDAAPVAAPA